MDKLIRSVMRRLDNLQSRERVIGFPLAVYRKFSDDQAGHFAALITYYGFLSLFPLLLVLVSFLDLFLGNSHLRNQIVTLAVNNFPLIGSQLQSGLHAKSGLTVSLIIGLVITFIGARGVANVIQDSMNHLWQVPRTDRPGFPSSFLRSLAIMVTIGAGFLLTTWLAAFGHGYGIILSLLANVALFLTVFRLAISGSILTRRLISSAIIAAGFWELLQIFGSFLVSHELGHLNNIYGTFAIVLGLMWWIYLQAEVTLWAVEIDVVRSMKLWPRSLVEPPLKPTDKQAYAGYAKSEKRRPEQEIDVNFKNGEM